MKIDLDKYAAHTIRLRRGVITIVSDENLSAAGVTFANNRVKPRHNWWVLCGFLSAWADTGDLVIVRQ